MYQLKYSWKIDQASEDIIKFFLFTQINNQDTSTALCFLWANGLFYIGGELG